MTKPAQNLLRDLLEYATYPPPPFRDISANKKWSNIQLMSEAAFRELELLANPVEREEMTMQEHADYCESRNIQNREPLRD